MVKPGALTKAGPRLAKALELENGQNPYGKTRSSSQSRIKTSQLRKAKTHWESTRLESGQSQNEA